MDLETRGFAFADVTNTQSVNGDDEVHIITGKAAADAGDVETKVTKFIVDDEKSSLLAFSRFLSNGGGDSSSQLLDRAVVSKFLHLCCAFDSVDCASALVNGEFGAVPLVNDVAESSGMSALHAAAKNQSSRCVEMLLKKHARTDLKTRDGRGLLPLELSVSCAVLDVTWDPSENSVEDLVVQLGEKDLTVVKLLSEKTKEIGKIAHARAIDGRVLELAAFLIVATEKVNHSVLSLHDPDVDSQEKATLFEYVVKHAVALGRATATAPPSSSRDASDSQCMSGQEKRKLILCEIQLLQLFGCTDHKKAASPLICACQAGDEGVVELLLNGNTDVNDVDADGNTALHWCLKTSKKESCPQINIMWLLLAHGARVYQKNKLGLTAVHIAAANGNSQALQVLLLEEPNCLNSKTEMKETPLFFAVKNRFMNCAELLLRWGASTDVFNLRRQRPLDLAESQDMRFLLNDTNIRQTRHAFPVKMRRAFWLLGDEAISATSEQLSPLTDEGSINDRTCSSATNTEICKYFESPTGCMRGAKCFFSHADEEDRQIKQRREMIHSPGTQDFARKIFVGGLPLSVDSDSLRNFFEERYGSVDEAVVIGIQAGNGIQSRGFGFVTFKNKESVLAAVDARYVTIMGKHVEIKSAVPRCILLADLHKSPQQHQEEESRTNLAQSEPPVQGDIQEMSSWPGPNEKIEEALQGCKTREEAKVEVMSWVDTLSRGKQKARLDKCKAQGVSMPPWIKIFKKWLPHFIKQMLKRDGVYALSSLKSDFKATFGLELDHGSLGYPKLSEFVRTFPDLCHVKYVPRGGREHPANHMILLPSISAPYQHSHRAVKLCSPSPQATSIDDSGECDSNDINCFQEAHVVSKENEDSSDSSNTVSHCKNPEDAPPRVPSRFLQFLDPDPIFLDRSWSYHQSDEGSADSVTGMSLRGLERHPVLEALARRKSNSSIFFLREFDFYDNYKASVIQGRCFACSQRRVLWANFPCLHLLWCADCKPPTTLADSNMDHKCVLCDIKVQKIDVISLHDYCRPMLDMANIYDFPTFDPVHSVQEEICLTGS